MKHIIIGDLHGKDVWREIDIKKYDKVIFLGDYVDDWTASDYTIYKNLTNIIALKKSNRRKVELLLGNHDIQYLYYPQYLCSGFRPSMQGLLTQLFNDNRDQFKVAYQRANYIFTHAGITNAWYAEFLQMPLLEKIKEEGDTIADIFNKVNQTAQHGLLHRAGQSRGGQGNGGITWADKKETMADMLTGYHQIVGHTVLAQMETHGNAEQSVTYIDVLDTSTGFYELEIE